MELETIEQKEILLSDIEITLDNLEQFSKVLTIPPEEKIVIDSAVLTLNEQWKTLEDQIETQKMVERATDYKIDLLMMEYEDRTHLED